MSRHNVRAELAAAGATYSGSVSGSTYTETFSTADRTHANATGVAVAGVIPAGGTGATAGGWDTAGNRNTAITTITEIKTSINAAIVDLADLKQLAAAIVNDLQAAGIIQ